MDERTLNGLYLFKALIKIGCEWQGDMFSKKWSERLIIPAGMIDQVYIEVMGYCEGTDYKFEGDNDSILIA